LSLPYAVAGEFGSAFAPNLGELVEKLATCGPHPTVVIDGPSGAGKSTVADYLAVNGRLAGRAPGGIQLVRLDDIYPGWDGLEAAAQVAEHILSERQSGRAAFWQRYDWAKGELTTWHEVDPYQPLIIEGCGAMSQGSQEAAEMRIWVTVAEELRKERALSRGGEDFEAHWDAWDQQFEQRIRRENPARFANIILAASE